MNGCRGALPALILLASLLTGAANAQVLYDGVAGPFVITSNGSASLAVPGEDRSHWSHWRISPTLRTSPSP